MPEGPEVWFLGMALNISRTHNFTYSYSTYGKHLLIFNESINKYEDWSFGLSGKVKLNEYGILEKRDEGWLNGKICKYDSVLDATKKLGLDWMIATPDEISEEVKKWKLTKKNLATLLLDQSLLCGIGVAWGSEILFHAGLNPQLKACDVDLQKLVASILFIRDQVKELYLDFLNKAKTSADHIKMANEWFDNLYIWREKTLEAYKKRSPQKIAGRTWWV